MEIKCHFKNYVTAPNMYDDNWIGYIQKKEKEHGNAINRNEAKAILKQLISVSRTARLKHRDAKQEGVSEYRLEKIWKGVFVVRDRETGMIRGRVTPAKRESLGLEREGSRGEQSKDSLRSRHDYAPAVYPSDFLEGIKHREIAAGSECTDYRAKEILETGRKNGWLKFDWTTKTWRGSRVPKPSKDDIKLLKCTLMLTAVQRKYWDLFSEMPLLRFNWIEPDQCEVTKWTIARARELGEEIDAAEAVRHYKAAWKCSQMPAKQPIRKEPTTSKVCGRNHYLPEMLRHMPRFIKGSREYLAWFEAEMNTAGEPDVVLEAGVKRGDVLVLEYDSGDPFAADSNTIEYIGADTFAAELKAEEERERAEQERKEAEERVKREAEEAKKQKETERRLKESERRDEARKFILSPWLEQLADPGSTVSRKLRSMPVESELHDGDRAEWVIYNLGFRTEETLDWVTIRHNDYDTAYSVLMAAQDKGYVVWVEELNSYHGVDWKPAELAA
jgi:hypothetical protein